MSDKAQPEAAYTPVSLDDFGVPQSVTLNLHTNYGRALTVRVVPLTCAQWEEIGGEVESPREPAQRNASTMGVYRKHADKAEEERNFRRVIKALELGGNSIEGETLAEKAANWRKKADRGLTMSIWKFLRDAAEGDRATILDGADAFQPVSSGNHEDLQ